MLRYLRVATGLALTASCAAATTNNTNTFAFARQNVLTAAEIVASHVSDVYQAVSQLRPDFLRRNYASPVPAAVPSYSVMVYLDGIKLGDTESLRSIPLGQVRVIRYLPPMEADLQFGGQHPAGAILVSTLP
jgi:hypothetical protein